MRLQSIYLLILIIVIIGVGPLFAQDDIVIFDQPTEDNEQYVVTRGNGYFPYTCYIDSVYTYSATIIEQNHSIEILDDTDANPELSIILFQWRNFTESGMLQVEYDLYDDSVGTAAIDNKSISYKIADAIWKDYWKNNPPDSDKEE